MSIWCYVYNVPFMVDCYAEELGRKDKKGNYKFYINKKIFELHYVLTLEEYADFCNILNNIEDVLEEIKNNLNECQTQNEKLVYIVSILEKMTAFEFHKIIFPEKYVERREKEIKEMKELSEWFDTSIKRDEKNSEFKTQGEKDWEKELYVIYKTFIRKRDEKNSKLKTRGEKDWKKETLTYYNTRIKEEEEKLESIKYKGALFKKTLHTGKSKQIEECIIALLFKYYEFATELDAILLPKGIDLLEVERESGLYIIGERNMQLMEIKLGGKTILNKIINDIHKEKEGREEKKETGKADIQKEGFKERLNGTEEEKEETLRILHKLIDGKKGRNVAMIIRAAIDSGKMIRPTFTEAEREFGKIGNKSGYNKYLSDGYNFTDNELNGIKAHFDQL